MKKVSLVILLNILGAFCLHSVLIQANAQPNAGSQPNQNPLLVEATPSPTPVVPPLPSPTPAAPTPTPVPASYENLPEYIELAEGLQNKNWQVADDATYRLLLKLAGEQSVQNGFFDNREWSNMSCDAFNAIEELWKSTDGGQQGFTSQWAIFDGQSRRDPVAFYQRIRWRDSNVWKVAWQRTNNAGDRTVEYVPEQSPNFSAPPPGHLPARLEWADGRDYRFDKLQTCSPESSR